MLHLASHYSSFRSVDVAGEMRSLCLQQHVVLSTSLVAEEIGFHKGPVSNMLFN